MTLLAAWAISISACGDGMAPAAERGLLSAVLDGTRWEGDAGAAWQLGPADEAVLYIWASSPRGAVQPWGVDESIILHLGNARLGTNTLGPGDALLLELVGGDVVGATYASGAGGGTVTLTRFDEDAVEGTVTFTATTTGPQGSHGATSTLRDGQFRAPVTREPR